MTATEIELFDKRAVAQHEAGHAVVAYVSGAAYVRAWLWLRTSDPDYDADSDEKTWGEKTWGGRTSCYHAGSSTGLVCVAGLVAECLAEDPEVFAENIVEYWEFGIVNPSETDLEGIPDDWEERLDLVEQAVKILTTHRAFHARVVAALLEHDSVSDGMLKELANAAA